jgi:hypothetical protein
MSTGARLRLTIRRSADTDTDGYVFWLIYSGMFSMIPPTIVFLTFRRIIVCALHIHWASADKPLNSPLADCIVPRPEIANPLG